MVNVKGKTGRFFKEFELFNLDDFSKNNPYEVLRVSSEATKKEMSVVYRKLISKFAHDKFHHENNLEKLAKANQIAKLINWARERIC